ncbi:hypothetical protein AB0D98_29580 [Streptomyces sp. NPDC047987]|uniref:hypothetical protein n=1 Tax=unclassified Streptomyces TaxID=2593676 RepID=UPI00341C4982
MLGNEQRRSLGPRGTAYASAPPSPAVRRCAYFYARETNHYPLNGKTDVNGTAHHAGGYLMRIDYGRRDGQVYAAKAPARVVSSTQERCLPTEPDRDGEGGLATGPRQGPRTPLVRGADGRSGTEAGGRAVRRRCQGSLCSCPRADSHR